MEYQKKEKKERKITSYLEKNDYVFGKLKLNLIPLCKYKVS